MTNNGLILTFAALAALALPVSAQTYERRATHIHTSNPYEGRCTISVVVNGAAEIDINGDNANLREVSGRTPYWQSFACTEPLPYSAAGLSIRAIRGNGRVTLTQDSSNGGVAVLRLTNYESGDQPYTLDVFWNTGTSNTPPSSAYNSSSSSYTSSRSYVSSEPDRVAQQDNAMNSCRAAVETRLGNEGYASTQVNSISLDDRGAQDFVTGTATADDRYSSNPYSFFCRVSVPDGRVLGLDVTPR
jgi:hypothetical protein